MPITVRFPIRSVVKVIASEVPFTAERGLEISIISGSTWAFTLPFLFSIVATNPEQAIYIYSEYAYNKSNQSFSFTDTTASEDWKKDGLVNGKSIYNWADALYTDMFS